mgnify:CR=1 FL=1
MSKKKPARLFRVYVAQVNQACIEVMAPDEEEARERGYEKWRREEAHSYVTAVECDDYC